MARPKAITDRELLRMIDKFIDEELGGNVLAFTYKRLEKYMRDHGYPNIKEHVLRHNALAKEYVNQLKQTEKEAPIVLASYKPLDVNALLQSCSTVDTLKTALVSRDDYYRKVVHSANNALEGKRKLEEDIEAVKADLAIANRQLEKADERAQGLKKEIEALKAANQALREALTKHVYPEIAQTLLAEDHIVAPPQNKKVENPDIIEADTGIDLKASFLKLLKNDK